MFSYQILIILVVTIQNDVDGHEGKGPGKGSIYVRMPGNVMLGGLVAVHDDGGQNNFKCESEITSYGIQRVEAMRYAITKVNDGWKGTGLKLGIEIRDTCGSETQALDESLQFVVDRVQVCRINQTSTPMFGVVGASMSLLTAAVANLLRLFQIPVISYAATSNELSDKVKFKYLLRTVPPDSFQSEAMVDFIIQTLKWESVFVIYSLGSYGEYGYQSFVDAAQNKRGMRKSTLCIVNEIKVRPETDVQVIRDKLIRFKEDFPNVTGIVCYCEVPDVQKLLSAIEEYESGNYTAYKYNPPKHSPNFNYNDEDDVKKPNRQILTKKKFKLIGSDTTLAGVKSSNSIIFSLHFDENNPVLRHFYDNWYCKLRPTDFEKENRTKNPWFNSFWQKACAQFKAEKGVESSRQNISCAADSTEFSLCHEDARKFTRQKDDKISYTIDAVDAFSHAIMAVLNASDGDVNSVLKFDLKSPSFLEDYLEKVEFNGTSEYILFNESVVRGSYDINQYSKEEDVFKVIGQWKNGNIQLHNVTDEELAQSFGESSCQQNCTVRSRRIWKLKKCCWICEECNKNSYVLNDTCKQCSETEKPIKGLFNGCEPREILHLDSIFILFMAVVSGIGILSTLYTIKVFVSNNDTPLVKASARELTYLLLFGILVLFCLPFILIVSPTELLCAVVRIVKGAMLSLCYGTLFVKTNRIARIFSGKQDLIFLTPKWQLTITGLLMIPQLLISAIGFLVEKESMKIDYLINDDYGRALCIPFTFDMYATIAYNLLLLVPCTFYAFRTRKAPSNFNEARHIGFVMYTTCVIWLVFMPVYFGTNGEYSTVSRIIFMVMVALTLLVGLFGLKMYILIFRPDKNSQERSKLRTITMASKETVIDELYNMPSPSPVVRFHKSITNTTLMSHAEPEEKHEKTKECSRKNDDVTDKDSPYFVKKTLMLDRGTSTADDNAVSENVFHKTLHKAFTL